jgi:hypothetical protein
MHEKCSCGSDCCYLDKNEGPCDGEVKCIDEVDDGDGGWLWIHCCKRHRHLWDDWYKEIDQWPHNTA